jgi:prepilin-type N-terminal cleavage/methylation domain-containing protein
VRTGSIARARRGRRGFTLLELMISTTVFLLVAGAVVTAVVVSNALNTTNRETALASRAAQSALEEMKAVTFSEVFARYNDTAGDDPGAGSSPGSAFVVEGLDLQDGDADGFVGTIEFPGTGKELIEDVDERDLGMPRDLNGDGGTDAADHAGDYRILPVRVTVEWSGKNGERALELVTVLTEL